MHPSYSMLPSFQCSIHWTLACLLITLEPYAHFVMSVLPRVPGPADKWHQTNGVSQFLVLQRAVDPC